MKAVDLDEIAKKAEKIAMGVHESLRETAFKSAFEALMQAGGFVAEPQSRKKKMSSKSASEANNSPTSGEVETLMQIDRTEHQEIMNASSVLDRSLHVLRIAQEEFQIDGLKPSQIAKVLTDKFRCRTSRQAVQQALDAAGDKVDRVPRSSGAIFRIMAKGEVYLRTPKPQGEAKQVAEKARKKSAKVKSKKVVTKSATKKESNGKRKSSRPGPKTLITALVASGFLKTAKTISAIQAQLEENQGYKYKSSELSPTLVRLLRDQVISRSKNSDGQYEYKAT